MRISFVVPNNAAGVYQGLSEKYSAIEPPTWALLLAQSVRSVAGAVEIIDTNAEALSDEQLATRIKRSRPDLVCFVAYGQNVNAGTTSMSGVVRQAAYIKENLPDIIIGVVGSHVQALPVETLEKERSLDLVFLGEGVYPLLELAGFDHLDVESLDLIKGIAFRTTSGAIQVNTGANFVASSELAEILPGYAWDLLPYKEKPLDLYRSPLWHADYNEEFRSPYAAIQTSLGCRFKCSFCMINLINKDDDKPMGLASNYNTMRHWDVENVKKTISELVEMGVRTIRITDEMFFLNKKYYMPIVQHLAELNTNDDLRLWAYSRIDTVPNPENLKLIRKAGFRWLCLGIESGNRKIRLEVAKGKFEEVDVKAVVAQIELANINVLANYIYGLPGDTLETIEETFSLSCELNTLGWNTYAAMALPGSPLYADARENNILLPQNYEDFSFHSYGSLPLPTNSLHAYQVLARRDEDFIRYFSRNELHEKMESKFGRLAVHNVTEMTRRRLSRRIIDEAEATNE